jgi:hypoxanthine-guanine phosphoribosyltransferase
MFGFGFQTPKSWFNQLSGRIDTLEMKLDTVKITSEANRTSSQQQLQLLTDLQCEQLTDRERLLSRLCPDP